MPDEHALALSELVDPIMGIIPSRPSWRQPFRRRSYTNGRHRTTAMLETEGAAP